MLLCFFSLFPSLPPLQQKCSTQERISGDDLEDFLARTQKLNSEYNSEIVTEFAFNGMGILEKVKGNKH